MTRKQSTSFNTSLFDERLKRIDEAKSKEKWFLGFTNAVTYFEHYGYWAIRFYCNRKNITLTQKAHYSLKQLGATELALLLRTLKLITNDTYSKMRSIITERNKIVHPGRKGIRYAEKKKDKKKHEWTLLLKQAKECLLEIKDAVKGRNKP